MKRKKNLLTEKIVGELAGLKDDAERARFLARWSFKRPAASVQTLIEESRKRLRVDPHQALALAEAALAIAQGLKQKDASASSFRAKANALYNVGRNQEALEYHAQALEIFRALGNLEEEGRTLNSSIQPHCLLGQYGPALEAADGARRIFQQLGDTRRAGHVEINVGNIYHRQDRFEEGLARYERAYEMLLPHGDSEGIAVALYNMAVCLITLNDFPRALATYQRARKMFVHYGMKLLVTQSDYNIAYLYYLRGEYGRAIQMLRATREESEKNGDAHVLALCYLDLSEIYLELNLSAEAMETAHQGYLRFRELGMAYEEAKCMANKAVALSQLGKSVQALELFAEARLKFVKENNVVWPSLIDLYRAVVLSHEGRFFEARRLCKQAADFFEDSALGGKAVLCRLLLARLSLQTGDIEASQEEAGHALALLAKMEAPVLSYQAHFLMGEIRRANGDARGAYESWQTARAHLETLRSSLRSEELKISFMKNRLEVYENLIRSCLEDPDKKGAAEESFQYIELAKSRSLMELLQQARPSVPIVEKGQSELGRRIREMREELNWYYRRIEIEQLRSEESARKQIQKLEKQAQEHENELLRALRELPSSEGPAALPENYGAATSLANIRESLPAETALIEYFSVHGQFLAAIVTRDGLKIVPLTPATRVAGLVRMLRFQLSKTCLGKEYIRMFERPLLAAAQAHLRELFGELVAPLLNKLNAKHLVIVPHGALHYVPFHALFDGHEYLIDSHPISYAPSSGIYSLCQRKKMEPQGAPMVLGVPDARAPFIEQEVRAVAAALPGSKLVIGAKAAEEALRSGGEQSRLIHLATHGMFRQDNPMFSGIRLGSSYLNLYDLYHLKLGAELVTLSGCATGLNVVAAGDELLGLVRGLLFAGAQSLLLTLWDVHDKSTAEFMASFYKRLGETGDRAGAFQDAVREIRSLHPHPYFWAPFMLVGRTVSA